MRTGESGNVFFYIFLCIALLGALSFAISQGGRSSVTTLSGDRVHLIATEIIAYGDTVSKAVTQLRLRGVAENRLSFAHPDLAAGYGTMGTNPDREIFNPAGGAIVYQPPPAEATVSAQHYQFLANNEVQNIGTTCAAATCVDLVMAAGQVRLDVCIEINDLLGVTNPAGAPPVDTDINQTNLYAAAADPFNNPGLRTVGNEDTALSGVREGCFLETDDTEYVYFKVLMAR